MSEVVEKLKKEIRIAEIINKIKEVKQCIDLSHSEDM